MRTGSVRRWSAHGARRRPVEAGRHVAVKPVRSRLPRRPHVGTHRAHRRRRRVGSAARHPWPRTRTTNAADLDFAGSTDSDLDVVPRERAATRCRVPTRWRRRRGRRRRAPAAASLFPLDVRGGGACTTRGGSAHTTSVSVFETATETSSPKRQRACHGAPNCANPAPRTVTTVRPPLVCAAVAVRAQRSWAPCTAWRQLGRRRLVVAPLAALVDGIDARERLGADGRRRRRGGPVDAVQRDLDARGAGAQVEGRREDGVRVACETSGRAAWRRACTTAASASARRRARRPEPWIVTTAAEPLASSATPRRR